MKYISKESREQLTFLPDSLDEYVSEGNPVRVIDAFVDSVDMEALGFLRAKPNETGRPAYDPRDLSKLYVYGYYNGIRSSRKLKRECGRNVEVMYLLGKLCPDFRTIADFRKDNAKALRRLFREFTKICMKLELIEKDLLAVDGTKLRAVNSKDNAYNREILEKKLARIDVHISEYLKQLDDADAREEEADELTAEQVKAALNELRSRKDKYNGYLEELTQTGKTQILLTDPDAHRMHTKDGFNCCYNVQTAVDTGSHLIVDYEADGSNTDQGKLSGVSERSKEILGVDTLEVVADKGYESREDILECIMNGTIANVALKYDKSERLYTLEYEEADITEEMLNSTKSANIRKCLHAGVLPKCYEGTSLSVELQEESEVGCFTRNDDDTVTCPMGQTLHKLRDKGPGSVYGSKDACRQCPNRCKAPNFKTIYFGPGTKHVAVKMFTNSRYTVIHPPEEHVVHNSFYRKEDACKKVLLSIKENKGKLKKRMCSVEHPFGTIKWYSGAHYLLCRGKEKVNAEIGLSFLAYNLKRAINMVGTKRLIEAMG